jgi:hypothetical protein
MTYEETNLQPLDVAPPPAWPGAPVPAPTEPAPPRRPPTAALLALVIVMLAAGVAGYAITSEVRGTSTNVATSPGVTLPSGGGSLPAAPSQPADPDENVLTRLVLQRVDVGADYDVQTIPNGNRVTGTTTLDLCNGTYPSEVLRSARLQVAEIDATTALVMSTEGVLYARPADTTQAFSELQKVKKSCPNRAVESPVGEDTTKTHFNATPDAAWPRTASVDRLAFDVTTTPEQGTPSRSIAVYLRRGRALIGVYFSNRDATQPPVQGRTTIPAIVQLFAERLAALPAAVVNRG